MSGLYANHGFADGKQHRVNVRLVAKNEDLIIRMRDDFESINITDIYKKDMEEKGSEEDMGLAIVMRMTKDVKYAAAFGANNLIIRV
jgi:anti-sigma regulatory factor (Ser/Thr protein kinase)